MPKKVRCERPTVGHLAVCCESAAGACGSQEILSFNFAAYEDSFLVFVFYALCKYTCKKEGSSPAMGRHAECGAIFSSLNSQREVGGDRNKKSTFPIVPTTAPPYPWFDL